jgi:hypothetical protein
MVGLGDFNFSPAWQGRWHREAVTERFERTYFDARAIRSNLSVIAFRDATSPGMPGEECAKRQ